MLEKFGCGAKECRWFGWKKIPHQNQTLKAIQLCHPSIVQRWTSYHKDIFQYINGESIITFFLFLLLLFLRSEQSDKWQRQFQILDKWRRKKTHFSALQITWNPFPCLLFLLSSSLAWRNIWLLFYSRPAPVKSNLRKLPNILPLADILPDFIWEKIESGILQFFLMMWRF